MRGVRLFLMCTAAATLCGAAQEGFERFRVILDRQPFGQEPIEQEPVRVVPVEQSFARNLRLSMLFEGPDGSIRAGIVDNSSGKSYILSPGERRDGLELVEADLQASEAMLRRGDEVVLFKLEAGEREALTRTQQADRQASYADRRRALLQRIEDRRRQQEQERQEPPEPRLTGEALRKHLEEVQMDAIRRGLPPLPMPLTPEMDAQLVSEGVLDP